MEDLYTGPHIVMIAHVVLLLYALLNRKGHEMRSLPNPENENARFQGVSAVLVPD